MSAAGGVWRLSGKLALCAVAIVGGAAVGRYTNVARFELGFAPPKALASASPAMLGERPRPLDARQAQDLSVALAKLAVPELAALSETQETSSADASQDPVPFTDGLASALRAGKIMTGATQHRLILFTFDDGPSRFTTPLLLDRLDANGIRAVFFLTGSNMRGENVAERMHQEIAKEAVRRGHVVASHGYMHRQLPMLDDKEALAELTRTEEIFEQVLGGRPWLFRPPGGAHSKRTDRLAASRGYTTVLWNLGAGDFQVRSAEQVHQTWREVLERREAQGERGGIILLHDTYSWSVEAFQRIVDDLLARNCDLLAKGEELYDFADDPRYFFETRGEADESAIGGPVVLDAETLALRQARLRADTSQRCRGELSN